MPYRICKSFEIENGHMLAKHPEKCRFPHGHSRTVEFLLEADTLDDREMVCDFKLLKELMSELLDSYDHALCVNTDDPQYSQLKAAYGERVIEFYRTDPTTEVLARAIYEHCQARLTQQLEEQTDATLYPVRPEVRLVKVRVSETSSSWAEYWE
jgi:6-pyruvoyltetrahydropterin/6-carboxytetrahydropterin synthase